MIKKPKRLARFEPGHGFSRDDWEAVSNNPEWTENDIREARPFTALFPELAALQRGKGGRPKAENPKKQITLRLDSEIVDRARATGPGWQSRINAALRKAFGL